MKWIILCISVLLLLGAIVVVIGAMLPPTHTAKVSIQLNEPREEVWQRVADIAGWPSWNTNVTSIEQEETSDGHQTWIVSDSNGRIPSKILESTPPADGKAGRLVTKIADPSLPYGGTWTWEIMPSQKGCAVSITEDGEIYNPVFRFLARYVFGYTGTAEAYLKALGESFGEEVTPEVE